MPEGKSRLRESPSQTAGPYVHIGCTPGICGISNLFPKDLGARMIDDATPGQHIIVEGHVYDGGGAALKDAMIEIWQADHQGHYRTGGEPDATGNVNAGNAGSDDGRRGVAFAGWGRQACDLQTGGYRFATIKPGPVSAGNGQMQAPHISFWIVARGINIGLNTRLYFPDEAANADCPILNLVAPARRQTLIASQQEKRYIFDIHLQGDNETVFFAI